MVPVTYEWYEELTAGDGSYLDKSINFQAGQASMMLQCICRAHGLGTSVMDAWDPELLTDLWIGYIFLDDFGRTKPAFLNSTGVMYPSVECILKLLCQCT